MFPFILEVTLLVLCWPILIFQLRSTNFPTCLSSNHFIIFMVIFLLEASLLTPAKVNQKYFMTSKTNWKGMNHFLLQCDFNSISRRNLEAVITSNQLCYWFVVLKVHLKSRQFPKWPWTKTWTYIFINEESGFRARFRAFVNIRLSQYK